MKSYPGNKGKRGNSKTTAPTNSSKKGDQVQDRKGPSSRKKDVKSETTSTGSATTVRTSPLNDISWYDHNSNLTQAAANIPFPYRPGMKVPMSRVNDEYVMTVPGVIAVDWAPTIGWSTEVSDPASIAAKEIYAQVRKAYSGSLDADAPDFVIYILALDSIYSYISYLRRIYGVLNLYSPSNFVLPDDVLKVMGFDDAAITNLRAEKMQLFQAITDLTLRARKYACPYVFDYLSRHYWMGENIYMDAPSTNAQFFLYNQVAYYKFALLNTPDNVQAGGLQCLAAPTLTGATVMRLYEFGLSLLNALASSDDAYTISGYLMRAYDGAAAFTLPELDYGYVVEPVYVPEVLTQFENTFCVENMYYDGKFVKMGAWTTNNITQNPRNNTLLCEPAVSVDAALNTIVNGVPGSSKPIINMHVDAPTDKEVMIASRMMALISYDTSDVSHISCGSEIPVRIRMHIPMGYGMESQVFNVIVLDETKTLEDSQRMLATLFKLSNFHHGPMVRVYSYNGTAYTASVSVVGDVHNLTSFSNDVLENINRVAMYSEFGVFGR